MWQKGCASETWCQQNTGCVAGYMSCAFCCQGNLCNKVQNVSDMKTSATDRPTPTTPLPTTTKTPTTPPASGLLLT